MRTETLSTLKINKLSQEQYDRELANGNIDENAIYLTPDTELDLAEVEQTLKEQGDEIEVVKGDLTSHTNSSNAQFTLVREEFANADAETLKSAKEYSDANKNSAVGEAKAYTDQEIADLVNAAPETLDTLGELAAAMKENQDVIDVLNNAITLKANKEEITNEINAINENIENIEAKDLFETKHEEGSAIAVSDSAEAPFAGMKLYGKTTQNGTPTPDAPVPLVSVGDSGSVEVGVYGRNLIDEKEFITTSGANYIKFEDRQLHLNNSNGSSFVSGNVIFSLPKGKYYLKMSLKSYTGKNAVTILMFDDKVVYLNGITATGTILDLKKTTDVTLRVTTEGGNGIGESFFNLWLTSDNELPYEVGCERQTLTMPYTLRSVGDIKDEVDFAKGIKTQRFVSVDLGTVDYIYDSTELRFGGQVTLSGIPQVRKTKGLCEIYKVLSNGETYNRDWNNVLYFNGIGIQIHDKRYTDASALKTALSGVKLVYELATPIETPLTETELNAYRQLHTNKPTTTILSEADMEVDYVVDSTSAEYIENRLDTLKSDIDKISSGGSSLATVATTGDYNDLSNKPTIPTKTSQLTNDSSFINQTGLNTALEDKLSFDEEIVNSISDVNKIVPEDSGKYAAVNKVGGMSYKSRNLLEVTATTTTWNGVTFTINADKSIKVSGTATDSCFFKIGTTTLTKENHIISGCSGGSNTTYLLYAQNTNQSNYVDLKDGEVEFAVNDNGYRNVLIAVYSGATVNTTFYPMIRKATETNKSYEPYYNGLRNAEVTSITSTGENLLPYPFKNSSGNNYTNNGLTYTVKENGAVIVNGTTTADSRYYISRWLPAVKYDTYLCGCSIPKGEIVTMYFGGSWAAVSEGRSILIPAGTAIGEIYIEVFGSGKTFTNAEYKVMITTTPNYKYEPYKLNTLEIPTNVIATTDYGLGINESYYNYIDWERKVFVRNVAKVDLGTLDWTMAITSDFAAYLPTTRYWQKDTTKNAYFLNSYYSVVPFSTYTAFSTDKVCSQSNSSSRVCIYDTEYTTAAEFKAAMSGKYLVYALATPEEIDISNYLPGDNFLEVAAGGVIAAVNEYNYDVPTEISFFTSENPEKVIVADKIVGDLVGVAEEAQSLIGLESTIEELNYLHKETITKEGWLIPEEGTTTIELMHSAPGVIGLKTGNTYTFTVTYKDGATETEDVVAIDNPDGELIPGVVVLQGNLFGDIIIIDKANIDSEFNITLGTNHYWYPPSVIDDEIESILVTGTKSDGNILTHQEEFYNKIPLEHLPDNISIEPPTESPIKQYWEWTSSDTNSTESDYLGFEKPAEYNRCRVLVYDRKFTSDGVLGVYMPLIFPFARNKNSDTSWDEVEIVGRTLADVKLGNGEGKNQTYGGTEWVSTVSADVYFTDKGFMCNYVCGTEPLSRKTVTAGSGYPETYAGQISGVLSKDASVDSILDSSLVWTLGIFLQRNKGNYVEVTWYKD